MTEEVYNEGGRLRLKDDQEIDSKMHIGEGKVHGEKTKDDPYSKANLKKSMDDAYSEEEESKKK